MDSYATRAGGVVGITPRELGNTTYQDLSVTDGHKRASPALLDMSGALWDGVRLSAPLPPLSAAVDVVIDSSTLFRLRH